MELFHLTPSLRIRLRVYNYDVKPRKFSYAWEYKFAALKTHEIWYDKNHNNKHTHGSNNHKNINLTMTIGMTFVLGSGGSERKYTLRLFAPNTSPTAFLVIAQCGGNNWIIGLKIFCWRQTMVIIIMYGRCWWANSGAT